MYSRRDADSLAYWNRHAARSLAARRKQRTKTLVRNSVTVFREGDDSSNDGSEIVGENQRIFTADTETSDLPDPENQGDTISYTVTSGTLPNEPKFNQKNHVPVNLPPLKNVGQPITETGRSYRKHRHKKKHGSRSSSNRRNSDSLPILHNSPNSVDNSTVSDEKTNLGSRKSSGFKLNLGQKSAVAPMTTAENFEMDGLSRLKTSESRSSAKFRSRSATSRKNRPEI